MGFFHLHRASSAASSRSVSSVFSAASSHGTPRTSTDSADDYMSATLKPQAVAPRAPLLNLPFEILQQIVTYLDDASAAKFSLSNRHICYSVGTQRLAKYITSSPSRFDARDRLHETIEQALPGAWHCAWCEKFHSWTAADGPASRSSTPTAPCADYNSSLSSPGYTLRYHHVRLALAASKYGPTHGLPLTSFTNSKNSSLSLLNTPVQTSTTHTAKIKHGHFLLHTSFSLLLPTWAATHPSLLTKLWPLLPTTLTQHRANDNGHTGLMAALDNVARRGWRVLGAHSCADCATDWAVCAYAIPRNVAGEFVRLNVQTWRDLGEGNSPFDAKWRRHGPWMVGCEEGYGRCEGVREKGGVRDVFEGEGEDRGDGGEGARGGDEWEKLAYSWQMDKKRKEEREDEKECRAIWKYIERRAGA